MSSDSPLVIEGYFWLPDNQHRFYGKIDYDAAAGVRLHFFDTNLTRWDRGGPQGPGKIAVLHGEELAGRPLTLLAVYLTNWSYQGFGRDGGDSIDAFAETVLQGIHVGDKQELAGPLVTSSLRGLREFLIGGMVDGGPLSVPDEDLAADTLPVDLGEGASLLLVANRRHRFDRNRKDADIVASAQWSLDPAMPISRLERDYLQPLQDLILFATRSQSYVTSLTVQFESGEPLSVKVLQRAYPRPRETREVYALALNLRNHEDPAALIAAWYELRRKVGPVWSLFFAAFDRSESLLEDRLLGLLSFAEGYDRALRPKAPLSEAEENAAKDAIKTALPDKRVRAIYKGAINHANTKTLRERLGFLVANTVSALDWWDLDADLLRDELYDTRNWLIHWGERGKHVVEDSQGLADLVRRLIVVLYVNLLLELGLNEEEAANVVASGWRLEGLP